MIIAVSVRMRRNSGAVSPSPNRGGAFGKLVEVFCYNVRRVLVSAELGRDVW